MQWQTFMSVAKATLVPTVDVLKKAGQMGACLSKSPHAGWAIQWDNSSCSREEIMKFRTMQMKPKLYDISTLLLGLPCFIDEYEIINDVHKALQKEMFKIHEQVQLQQNNDEQLILLKRLTAARRLFNNTKKRWQSDNIWALIFDETARIEPKLCPFVVALSAYGVLNEGKIDFNKLPQEFIKNHERSLSLFHNLNIVNKASNRYVISRSISMAS